MKKSQISNKKEFLAAKTKVEELLNTKLVEQAPSLTEKDETQMIEYIKKQNNHSLA